MHKMGWKLEKVSFPGFYYFTQCEPENVAYRLDYNQEGITHKPEYVQMFSDCGWEYLFEYVGYSYFRKASDDTDINDDIFCDDESRLDMMRRVFKGRVLPLIILFFSCILPQLFININDFGHGNIVRHILSYTLFVLGILYIILFGIFTIQFYKYEKNIFPEKNIKIKYTGIFCGLFLMLIIMVGIVIWAHSFRL